jgi:T4 superinfection immunity protein
MDEAVTVGQLLIIVVGVPLFFVPTIIGRLRRHANMVGLVVANVFGFIPIVWVGTLIWSIAGENKKKIAARVAENQKMIDALVASGHPVGVTAEAASDLYLRNAMARVVGERVR